MPSILAVRYSAIGGAIDWAIAAPVKRVASQTPVTSLRGVVMLLRLGYKRHGSLIGVDQRPARCGQEHSLERHSLSVLLNGIGNGRQRDRIVLSQNRSGEVEGLSGHQSIDRRGRNDVSGISRA